MVDHPKLARTFARTATPELCDSLRTIESMPESTTTRLMRGWVIGELEQRHPTASVAVERAFEQADEDERSSGKTVQVDYVGVLLSAIEPTEPADKK